MLSFCELIIGGKDGLTPTEKTIIDRCVRRVYDNYFNDPHPKNMPILGDLYNLIRKQAEPEAQQIAAALELYVTGSFIIKYLPAKAAFLGRTLRMVMRVLI